MEFSVEAAPVVGVNDESDETPPIDPSTTGPNLCGHANAQGLGCIKEPGHPGRHRYRPYVNGEGSSSRPRANGNLAGQAADVLAQVNDVIGLGLMMGGLTRTASALASRNDVFKEQAHAALSTDPGLCRMILRAGTSSAKLSLAISYVMLGAAVAPYAKMELDERRAERDAE